MAITAKCSCGKRTSVGNSLAGSTIRCPSCGADVFVDAVSPTAKSPAMLKAERQKAAAGAAVSVSPGIIIASVVGVIVLIIALTLYLGPWTVGNKWAVMAPQANRDVTDVVNFAIQAYESEHFMYDARQSHVYPHVEGDAAFVPPMMAFTMPRHIIFSGQTNQGNYIGTYDTTNGEVSADIEFGGTTFSGLVTVKKAAGKFHVIGREVDGKVTAEVNGTPLKILTLKMPEG